MFEASLDHSIRQFRKWADQPYGWWRACSLFGYGSLGRLWRQSSVVFAMTDGQIPHGVESDTKSGQGFPLEPGNLVIVSFGMTEATGDHDDKGRSPRSSLRAGKPPTWQRGTVETASKQEVDNV